MSLAPVSNWAKGGVSVSQESNLDGRKKHGTKSVSKKITKTLWARYKALSKAKTHFLWPVERKRVCDVRNIHADKRRCFIIGNGPSIREQDLTVLKDEVVFVSNDFIMHDRYREINPTYHCVVTADYRERGLLNKHWYELMERESRGTIKIFDIAYKSIIQKNNYFNGHTIYYINVAHNKKIWKTGSLQLDLTKPVHCGNTVIIDCCLPLAHFMGVSEVYLLGVDCDYSIGEKNDYSQAYFFDPKEIEHKKSVSLEYKKSKWQQDVFECYEIAKREFEQNGGKIYNATAGGKLEVFPRVSLEDLGLTS